jgi:acetyl-CoA carboxylase biotin carboxyl carrier protein
MSVSDSKSEHPFDLGKLRELVTLMEQHGLTEVDLQSGAQHWKLKRGNPAGPVPAAAPTMFPPAFAPPYPPNYPAPPFPIPGYPPAGPPAAGPPGGAAPAAPPAAELPAIKSPTVGTYYESAAPGEKPFVTVGSKVTPETVVCIIEAMKVFNQITADVSGTIAEILVKNGDPVDFGQPLFRIK